MSKTSRINERQVMSTPSQNGYMLIFRGTDWYKGLAPEQMQQLADNWMAWFNRLKDQGTAIAGNPLEREGKIVSGKNCIVSDGPFAESKETIGGYFLLKGNTFHEAGVPVHGKAGVSLRSLKNQSIKENHMQKVTPFLWFDNQAEEAVKFYTSIFNNSKIGKIARYGEEGEQVSGRPKGSVMTVEFQLEGQEFVALNGGPHFKFTEAISFVVNCKTQAEVDKFWKKLSAGGKEVQCGWLKDKYGLSWQIVPTVLGELLSGQDAEKSQRVMQAMLKMVKLDIKKLKQAAKGRAKNQH